MSDLNSIQEMLQRRVPLSELTRRLGKVQLRHFLLQTNAIIRGFEREGKRPFSSTRKLRFGNQTYEHTIAFGLWSFAFLAKQAILCSSDYRERLVTPAEYFELVHLYNNLSDPPISSNDPMSAYRFLIRTSWEQFTYQEPFSDLIPRYYLMYRRMNDEDEERVLDIPSEWRRLTGIEIEPYMTLGFGAWAMAESHSMFDSRAFARSQVDSIRKAATPANMEAFFARVTADYGRFRSESADFVVPADHVKTEFNVLRKYPLIRTKPHELVAPVPQLVLEKISRGIYYELLTAHTGERRNSFLEQFGRVFERYVGMLLRRAYGEERVIHEPVYGKEKRRGPDWIVRDGSTMVLLECTGSGTTLMTRSVADVESVVNDVKKVYADRLTKFPRKIEDLRSGLAGVDVRGVERYLPVIVTHEPVFIEPITRAFLLNQLGVDAVDSCLLDVSDIEVITGWASHASMTELIDEWREAYAKEPQSVGVFLNAKSRQDGWAWRNQFLADTFDEFFAANIVVDWSKDDEVDGEVAI